MTTVYGEIAGWGATHDGRHTVRVGAADETQYARSMRLALERARCPPEEVDVVFPDALGVPRYDRAEAAALRSVFGPDSPPVTTQKPLIGRAHQGGSALDAANALLALRHRVLPPTAGLDRPAPGCELDFVRQARSGPVRTALVGARGFDGFNSSVLIRAYQPPGQRAGGEQ